MAAFWNFPETRHHLVALVQGQTSAAQGPTMLTYGDLDHLAGEWRLKLHSLARGLGRPLVVLEFETGVEAIAAYLGCLRAGFPLLVLEPGQLSPDSFIARTYAPEIVIARRDGAFAARLSGSAGKETRAEPHPDLVLLLSTSGSTGDPKLVRLSAENIDSNARSIAEYLSITPSDRAMTTLPMFYSYGLSVLNSYLSAGGAMVLTSHSVVDAAFWEDFRQGHGTSLALVPHQFELLDRSGFGEMDLPGLRYMTQAGGRLSPDLVRRFTAQGRAVGWQLFVMYGQTEAAPRISYVPPEALPEAAETIGVAIPGGRLRILDEEGREITAPRQQGELAYEGPNVMMGYALSHADLALPKDTHELRTGDLAERTEEGFFRITGRLKRFVKLFGLRLSLDQIEALLDGKGIPAHAVAVDDRLVLLLPDAGQKAAARDAVAQEYELPPSVIHVAHLEELPLLASGKTDHRALGRIAAGALECALKDAPAMEDADIAAMLMQATRAASIGPNDSFASLGGDSLGYLQVQMGLEARLGRAPEGWENMTLAELEDLAPAKSTGWSRVSIDVILRILGASLVVAQHASTLPFYGGTWILILLMGYSAARFQTRTITEGHPLRLLRKMLYPILPFYALIVLVYTALPRDNPPLSYFLLFGNYHMHGGGWLLEVYWFISLYVQLVLAMALVALIPGLRGRLARDPWRVSALALAGAMAVMAGLILWSGPVGAGHAPAFYYAERGFFECLPIFLIGWLLNAARDRRQTLIALAMAAVALPLLGQVLYQPQPQYWLALAILALVLVPPVPVPASIGRLLQTMASVSLFVYLLHPFVVHVLLYASGFDRAFGPFVTIAAALVLAYLIAWAAKGVFDWVDGQVLRRSRQPRRHILTRRVNG